MRSLHHARHGQQRRRNDLSDQVWLRQFGGAADRLGTVFPQGDPRMPSKCTPEATCSENNQRLFEISSNVSFTEEDASLPSDRIEKADIPWACLRSPLRAPLPRNNNVVWQIRN